MDILLLHGGGRTSEDWSQVAPLLEANDHRVAAVDMRPMAEFTWEDALTDLAIDTTGFDNPAVVGHSLGGIVAALWATRHPECPFTINFDGHTNPTGPFDGLSPQEELAAGEAMRAFLQEGSDDPATARIVEQLGTLDLFEVYRSVRCPLLVVSSTRPDFEEMLPPDVGAAFAAYRRGFGASLAAIAETTELLTLAELPTGHDMHLETPEEVARLILHMACPPT